MTRRFLRTVRVTVSPDEAADAMRGHRAHLDALARDGRLVASYRLADGDGFVDVFAARDLLDADTVARASPLVERGLAAWSVRAIDDAAE